MVYRKNKLPQMSTGGLSGDLVQLAQRPFGGGGRKLWNMDQCRGTSRNLQVGHGGL